MEANWPSHDAVLEKILFEDDKYFYYKYSIGKEIPIWTGSPAQGYLTGHIDLLFYKDGIFYVCDYKPDLIHSVINTNTGRKKVGSNFIQAVPQVAFYAKILKRMLGYDNVKCVVFNSHGAWNFDPSVLEDITKFMKEKNVNVPWTKYEDYF